MLTDIKCSLCDGDANKLSLKSS